MESNNIFNTTRLVNYLNRHIVLNYRSSLIGMAAVSGAITIIGFLTAIDNSVVNEQAFMTLYYVAFFIGGFLLTSKVFNEMHSPAKSILYMTLPVSNFEKLLGGWLYSTVIFVITSMVFAYSSYYLASTLASLAFSAPIQLLNIFETNFFKITGLYLVLQSMFLLGAIIFKKNSFLKVILSIFLLSIAIFIFTIISGRLILGYGFQNSIEINDDSYLVTSFFENSFVPITKTVFWYILGPFFLITSYFALKERDI